MMPSSNKGGQDWFHCNCNAVKCEQIYLLLHQAAFVLHLLLVYLKTPFCNKGTRSYFQKRTIGK